MLFGKNRASSLAQVPPGFKAMSLDSERALSGEQFGITTDRAFQQVTISVKSSEMLEVSKVVDLAHLIGHDQVRFVVTTLSSLYDDTVSVTLGDPHSPRARRGSHTDDLRGDAALMMTKLIEEGAAMDLDLHPMTENDVLHRASLSWSGSNTFPPEVLEEMSVTGRFANVDGRLSSAFEIDVDDTLAVDAVIDAIDALHCEADVSLVFRPALNGIGGRFAATALLYGASESEVNQQVQSLLHVCSPEHRLRIRRCYYGQDLMRMIPACSGLAPWQQMTLQTGEFYAR